MAETRLVPNCHHTQKKIKEMMLGNIVLSSKSKEVMPVKNTKIPNRLINEKSPYLLQHAYNPVNWLTWSDEAFAKARAEDKPVFLSIGYS